ncbi:MAG: hypothetical protein AB7U82_24820 [Blastocatellales bacterium]
MMDYEIDYDKMFRDVALSRVSIDRLERLHDPVEQEIRSVYRYMESRVDTDEDQFDDFGDELEQIEDLLGIAFVAAQVYLTTVRTSMVRLSKDLRKPPGVLGDDKAYTIFDYVDDEGLVNPIEPKSGLRFVRVVNAVANYWKHQDEWPTRLMPVQLDNKDEAMARHWDTSKVSHKNQSDTIRIVTSIGMQPGDLNMQVAASALGISDLWDLSPLRKVLEDWACSVLKTTS